jgi:two-component system, NtrC family, sensor kinase
MMATESVSSGAILRKPPEGLFARLMDSLKDIYALVLDQDHRVAYANVSFLEHFGLKWEEIAGRACEELGDLFSSPEEFTMGFCPTAMSPYYPARTLLTRQEGDTQHIYEAIVYSLSDDGRTSWVVWSLRDMTDHFNLQSQVRQLDELERSLVQASMDGIIVNDMMGNVLVFNEGASRILGYEPEEVIGKIKVSRLYPERFAHEIKQLIYDPADGGVGILENYETMVRHKNGALIPIWLSARILHEGDREVGIVGFFRDLRERKRLEEDLLRNERLATLGKMMAHISHEIKNPLATIGGFAAQLERQTALPEDCRHRLKLIRQEVQRLEKFLADLTTFTRGMQPQKTRGDLLAVVREVAELMEASFKERNVVFDLQTLQPVPEFFFDSGQMRQVFLNLFKNAVEAMPQGGRLTVTAAVADGNLVLQVADTGQGIAPENLQKLFTPFFSTKEGGTGLGLTICRGLIVQHHGEISLDSEVNRGTTCTIRLPFSAS